MTVDDVSIVEAPFVVCALPLWDLDEVLDVNPDTSTVPEWWLKRYEDLKFEATELIGYTIGLKEPVYDKPNFPSALCLDHTGMPFQGSARRRYSEDTGFDEMRRGPCLGLKPWPGPR